MPDDFVMGGDWGPWSPTAPDLERLRSTITLRLLSSIMFGRPHPLARALMRAETVGGDALGARFEALAEASLELERLPAKRRRNLLRAYQEHAGLEPVERARRPRGRYHKDQAAAREGAAA